MLSKNNASLQNYVLIKTIGKGFYSVVKLAKSKKDGRFYAIKLFDRCEIEKVNLKAFEKILSNEVHLLETMDHPHILRLVEYNTEGEVLVEKDGRAR